MEGSRTARALALLLALAASACGSRATDATPTGAVRAFLEAIEQSEDPHARERAYRLLCPSAQIALAERARGAAALGGRSFEPWEMIAEDRALLRHLPRRSSAYRERAIEGDDERRWVDVLDESGAARAVGALRVEGSWCVELDVPEPEPG